MKSLKIDVKPVSRTPLRELVRSRILDLLSTDQFAPGTDISEASLSKALGVSRSPLREALLLLSQDGYIENKPNRGFFVPVANPNKVVEIYTIISELERLALSSSGEAIFGLIDDLSTLNDTIMDPALDAKEQGLADREFHEVLISKCPNATLLSEIERLNSLGRRHDGATKRGFAKPARSKQHHDLILAALRSRDLESAAERLKDHWISGIDVINKWIKSSAKEPDSNQ